MRQRLQYEFVRPLCVHCRSYSVARRICPAVTVSTAQSLFPASHRSSRPHQSLPTSSPHFCALLQPLCDLLRLSSYNSSVCVTLSHQTSAMMSRRMLSHLPQLTPALKSSPLPFTSTLTPSLLAPALSSRALFSSTPVPSSASASPATRKTTQLKRMLQSKELEFLMEAHNGLSARIVEEAGFKGIWGSGLSISAAMGVRDSNEASYTQVLEVLEFMSDATTIPILLDADTGYGNFNNARILVRKLEQTRQSPARASRTSCSPSPTPFCPTPPVEAAGRPSRSSPAKIRAMKDTQRDPDFVVVARVEAFIAGWGLEEAMKSSEAYMAAGADAILMHSKRGDHSEIEAFMKEWKGRHPVIIVPTKYYTTPYRHLPSLGRVHRYLGQPQHARLHRRHAGDHQAHTRRAEPAGRGGEGGHRQGGVSHHTAARAGGGGEEIFAQGSAAWTEGDGVVRGGESRKLLM